MGIEGPDPNQPLAQLTEGSMVHYVLPYGPSANAHRPAVVVRVWSKDNGCSNLQVFTDGTNDGPNYASGIHWATSAVYSEEHAPGTWHWVERV